MVEATLQIASPDAAYEPNNTFQTASKIELNAGAQKMFLGGGDEDWYAFTLDETQIVTIGWDRDSSYSFNRALYDSKLEMYNNSKGEYGDGYWETLTAGLEPGYGDPDSGKSFAYSLIVKSETLPKPDFEPNNSPQQAHPISLGFSADALLVSKGDDDWFVFTLDATKQVVIAFKAYDNGLPSAYLADAYGNSIQNIGGGSVSPVLKAGTYSVKVSDYSSDTSIKYGLSVKEK